MKNIAAALMALVLAGCMTGSNGTSSLSKMEKTTIILKHTARTMAYYAVLKDPQARTYLETASAALSRLADSQAALDPRALDQALAATNIKELKTPEARALLSTFMVIYEIQWADRGQIGLPENSYARALVSAAVSGIALGLDDAKVTLPPEEKP